MNTKPKVTSEDMMVIYKLVDARGQHQSIKSTIEKFVDGILKDPIKSSTYIVSEKNKTKRIATFVSSYSKYRRNTTVSRPTKTRNVIVSTDSIFPMKFDVKSRSVIIETKAQFEYITALAR